MKEFIISEAQTEKAILVGLVIPEQNELSWPIRQGWMR